MNPLFKPTPPISNAAKEEIYKLHRSDSTKHTPRQLGTTYNISIKRVEAILRMKHLEKEMIAEGFVAQENFTKGMEQLMGVKAVRSEAITEPLVDILPQVGSPKFEAVDEDKAFTAVDAAKVLKRRPLAEIKSRMLEEERQKPFKLVDSIRGVPQVEAAPTKAISRNSAEANPRFKFAFQDTSKNNKVCLYLLLCVFYSCDLTCIDFKGVFYIFICLCTMCCSLGFLINVCRLIGICA